MYVFRGLGDEPEGAPLGPPEPSRPQGGRPLPYREAVEEAQRRQYLEYTRDCAGRRMLERLERRGGSAAERVERFERRRRGIPKLFEMKRLADERLAKLKQQHARGESTRDELELERARLHSDLRTQIEAEFPQGYVLGSEQEELANARCALSRARWEAVRSARTGTARRRLQPRRR